MGYNVLLGHMGVLFFQTSATSLKERNLVWKLFFGAEVNRFSGNLAVAGSSPYFS